MHVMEPPQLADYVALEYILLGDLRDLLDETPDEQNRGWLLAVIDTLFDTLPRELELRSQGGYLHEVVEQVPNWSVQVSRLHEEKVAIYERLGELREKLVEAETYCELADRLSQELRDWMTGFIALERHERRMMQHAFNIEIGVGD